jgi:hypothetical protein
VSGEEKNKAEHLGYLLAALAREYRQVRAFKTE